MVTNIDFTQDKELNNIKENPYNYIVLDASKLQYNEDKETFTKSIEVLDMINIINWTNDFYKNVKSDIRIDTSILYKVIDAGLTNQNFNDKELKEYFNTITSVEVFFKYMTKFREFTKYIPHELELVLFGLSYKEQKQIQSEAKDKLFETYGSLSCDTTAEKINIDTFIKKVKELIVEVKKW